VRNIPQITNIPATITSGSGSGDGSGSDGVVVVEQPPSDPIKMEVGIEDCLHIEFEFDKSKYYLDDVVIGKCWYCYYHYHSTYTHTLTHIYTHIPPLPLQEPSNFFWLGLKLNTWNWR